MTDIISKIKGGMRSKPIKILVLAFCYLALGLSVIGSFIYIFLDYTLFGIVIAILAPSISGFLSFMIIVATILIIRIQFWNKKKRAILVLAMGAFVILTSFFPYYSVPASVFSAEAEMTRTYGTAYQQLDTSNMLQIQYNVWEQFNPQNYDSLIEVQYDIPYITNNSYGDTILYDSYLPKNYASKGANSIPIIVNIHGGAWVLGAKGPTNAQERSKYLASKGYAVFDVSYGLYGIENMTKGIGMGELGSLLMPLLSIPLAQEFLPPYKHDYTIPEQVENLGIFFNNLTTSIKANYSQLNLNKIFTMGLSAGGQLSSLIAAGYNSTAFGDQFPDNMTIIGGIHFYPPTDLLKMKIAVAEGRLGGLPAITNIFDLLLNTTPSTSLGLLQNYSAAYHITQTYDKPKPNVIILHGSKDNLVPYFDQGVTYKYLCNQAGTRATLITIQGAGHAFDLSYTSPGYQITLYYIERYLALEAPV
ncbi:MAG: alpha/beta hydrolase [Candidatus Lokiarchaeota archaeon]|nr:alpha/beta hydrolase [Candidatus Lokiarchaeota archaeon]